MSLDFVNLHVHAHTSILDGYSTVDEYLKKAQELGQKGLGLTDHGNLFSTYSFVNKARQEGITPTPGIEFYVAPENPEGAEHIGPIFYGPNGKQAQYDVSARGAYLHLTAWAYNNTGMYNLFKLSTLSNSPTRFYKAPRIDFNLLADHSEGLIVSTGCPSSEISTRFLLHQDNKAYEYANRLKEVFGDRLFIEVMDHNMPIELERTLLPKQLELSKKLEIPLLATNDCHYAHKENHLAHEEMLCSQSKSRMSDKKMDEGGTRFAFSGSEYYLKSAEDMNRLFPHEDFPNALKNSALISEMSTDIKLDFNPKLKPKPILPEGFNNELEYYKYLINKGYKEKYGNSSIEIKKEAQARNKKEFEVIHSSDFIGYMLVVREYIMYGKEKFSTRNAEDEIVASSVGVGRGCFLPGNKVRTNKGEVNIEKMTVHTTSGDIRKVLTHDGNYHNVEDVFEYDVEKEDCVRVVLSHGKEFTSTSDHKIFKKDVGFIEAEKLQKGDKVLGSKRSQEKTTEKELEIKNNALHNEWEVVSVDHFSYTGKVYDIQVSNVHNYTIADTTVHNSVGGSIHAYELGISDIDPIKHDLLFERFLSSGRGATYKITYDDGTTEEINVSGKKRVKNADGKIVGKYIHQLELGDEILDDLDS